MKILYKDINIPALKGSKTIARADEVFTSYIDSDFENYGTDKKGVKTEAAPLAVLEIEKDGTFKEIFESFGNPEELVLSQEQIIKFCEDHKDKLRQGGYGTFFLFKTNEEFFVAGVHVDSDGLSVRAHRFSVGGVWGAEYRRRVVVPQLTLKNLDSGHSDSLTLSRAIEVCKENGYKVIKEM